MAALGAEPLLQGPDLPKRVSEATGGRGLDRVYDSIGKATQAQSLAMLESRGSVGKIVLLPGAG